MSSALRKLRVRIRRCSYPECACNVEAERACKNCHYCHCHTLEQIRRIDEAAYREIAGLDYQSLLQ